MKMSQLRQALRKAKVDPSHQRAPRERRSGSSVRAGYANPLRPPRRPSKTEGIDAAVGSHIEVVFGGY